MAVMDDYYQRMMAAAKPTVKPPTDPRLAFNQAMMQQASYQPAQAAATKYGSAPKPPTPPKYDAAGMNLRYKEMMDAVKSRNARVTDMSDFYQRAVAINRPSVFGVPIRQYTQGYMDDFYQRSSAQGRISNIKPGVMDPKQYNTNQLDDYYFRAKLAGGSVLPPPTYPTSTPYADYPVYDFGGSGGGGGYGAGYRPNWMTGLFMLNANR